MEEGRENKRERAKKTGVYTLYMQERMSRRRRREGVCNCVEHHVSQADQPMSKYGEYVQHYVISQRRWPNKDFV